MGKVSKRLTYEHVKQVFKNAGCELLSDGYTDNKTNLEYKCNCENVSNITFGNFQTGRRCMKCGIKNNNQQQLDEFLRNENLCLKLE